MEFETSVEQQQQQQQLLATPQNRSRTLSDSFLRPPSGSLLDRSNSLHMDLSRANTNSNSNCASPLALAGSRAAMIFPELPTSPPARPGPSKCRVCFRKFFAFLLSNVGLCVLIVAYSFGGALMFQAIEKPFEVETTNQVNELRARTIDALWNITYQYNVFQNERWQEEVFQEMKRFRRGLMDAINAGYEGPKNSGREQWSFPGAFLFSLTVISTIGYGNLSPRTEKGKLATMAYAILGIPLMLLYLTNIGDLLAKSFRYVYGRLCSCKSNPNQRSLRQRASIAGRNGSILGASSATVQRHVSSASANLCSTPNGAVESHHQPTVLDLSDVPGGLAHFDVVSIRTSVKKKVRVPITLCLFIMTSYICGGGILFSLWEKWNFLDGTYFCFVTLSLIGFGDFVPGKSVFVNSSRSDGKLAICSLYLLAGMALLAMCFKLMQEEVIHKIRQFGRRIGIIHNPARVPVECAQSPLETDLSEFA